MASNPALTEFGCHDQGDLDFAFGLASRADGVSAEAFVAATAARPMPDSRKKSRRVDSLDISHLFLTIRRGRPRPEPRAFGKRPCLEDFACNVDGVIACQLYGWKYSIVCNPLE